MFSSCKQSAVHLWSSHSAVPVMRRPRGRATIFKAAILCDLQLAGCKPFPESQASNPHTHPRKPVVTFLTISFRTSAQLIVMLGPLLMLKAGGPIADTFAMKLMVLASFCWLQCCSIHWSMPISCYILHMKTSLWPHPLIDSGLMDKVRSQAWSQDALTVWSLDCPVLPLAG